MSNQVSQLLNTFLAETDVLNMEPKVFLRTLVDIIPDLVDEFGNIDISIAKPTILVYRAAIRQGLIEYVVALGIMNGCFRITLYNKIQFTLQNGFDPGVYFFDIPARVEGLAGSEKSVWISIPSDAAR